tara:strand:+ start:298 stop:1353 length:1056 start_codon:yes stop_codon:yes gene_type:complete
MANVTINTNISNVTDDQSSTFTASLNGVPNTVSAIITDRKFTPNTNYSFTKIPHVSFVKTSDPNSYNYTVTKNVDGSYSFTINYNHPLSPPTTDIIEFFAEAKSDATVVGSKIYGWNVQDQELIPQGEKRILSIYGDVGAKLKIAVTKNPRLGPVGNATFLVDEFIATIGLDGKYETLITFPSSTISVGYRILLTEFTSGTFSGGLTDSPITIFLDQWPLQQTKLEIIETGDTTWVLPAASVTNAFYYYSGARGTTSYKQDFSFTCTHTGDISLDGTFTSDDFTKVTGQSSTLTNSTVNSLVSYNALSIVIDNTASPNSVVISGKTTIQHGFDAGGHTYITLNINDILNHA